MFSIWVVQPSEFIRNASPRRGRERIWELEPEPLAQARQYLDRISQEWDQALGRLKAFVED